MNIALAIAGGTGYRMGQDVPKQFINVYDKPILFYVSEGFEKHPQIDAIEVVCLDGWHDVVWAYAKQYRIDKLLLLAVAFGLIRYFVAAYFLIYLAATVYTMRNLLRE